MITRWSYLDRVTPNAPEIEQVTLSNATWEDYVTRSNGTIYNLTRFEDGMIRLYTASRYGIGFLFDDADQDLIPELFPVHAMEATL